MDTEINNNDNNNVRLSCPERSHDTYQPKYDILYICRAQSYQNNLHQVLKTIKVLYGKTNTHTHMHTQTAINSNVHVTVLYYTCAHACTHMCARTHAQ